MPHLLRSAIAATAILAATAASSSAAVPHTNAYFLINGPDYREVTRAVFDDMRSSCLRIAVYQYPESNLTEYHCYL